MNDEERKGITVGELRDLIDEYRETVKELEGKSPAIVAFDMKGLKESIESLEEMREDLISLDDDIVRALHHLDYIQDKWGIGDRVRVNASEFATKTTSLAGSMRFVREVVLMNLGEFRGHLAELHGVMGVAKEMGHTTDDDDEAAHEEPKEDA